MKSSIRTLTLLLLTVVTIAGYSNFAFASSSSLTYFYTSPYSGGGNLTISNKGGSPIEIVKLSFTSNAAISGNPWGTLWGYQSTLTSTPDPDQINTNFTINENPTITIGPGQSASLFYNLGAIGGPLHPYNAAMSPMNVTVTLKDQSQVTIPIKDMCEGSACNDPGNGKRIMGYYPDWAYWRSPKFLADQIPFDKVNTVAYAFSIFDNNGNISLYDHDSDSVNLPTIQQARQQYPYLNASLSFGGWSWASTPAGWHCTPGSSPFGPASCFSQMAKDPTAVTAFVTNAIKAMKEVHFNGVDIDWEYPLKEDSDNFVNLLQKLRAELDKQGLKDNTHYYLTIAAPAGVDKIQNLTKTQWQSIAAAVDYVDVMTYDFHGAWDAKSDFMSAMQLDPINDPTTKDPVLGKYNVVDAMSAYTDNGISANKLVVGVPAYGRMANIANQGATKGLYQPITGVPQGEWDNQQSGFTGMINYKCIVDATTCGNNYKLPSLTLVDLSDSLGQYSKTPWGFSNNLFITYDDAHSAGLKAEWIKANSFAGVMMWDFSGDFAGNDQRSLVNVFYQAFQKK